VIDQLERQRKVASAPNDAVKRPLVQRTSGSPEMGLCLADHDPIAEEFCTHAKTARPLYVIPAP
jgi:hypothetical protein